MRNDVFCNERSRLGLVNVVLMKISSGSVTAGVCGVVIGVVVVGVVGAIVVAGLMVGVVVVGVVDVGVVGGGGVSWLHEQSMISIKRQTRVKIVFFITWLLSASLNQKAFDLTYYG